jgi:hypothetical protein
MSLNVFLPTLPSARAKGIVLSLGVWLVPWLAGGPWDSPSVHGAEPSPYPSPGEGVKGVGDDGEHRHHRGGSHPSPGRVREGCRP